MGKDRKGRIEGEEMNLRIKLQQCRANIAPKAGGITFCFSKSSSIRFTGREIKHAKSYSFLNHSSLRSSSFVK